MSKLTTEQKFFDVSDYGRPIAAAVAKSLRDTRVTPVHMTFLFGCCGILAVYCILRNYFIIGGILLILKSVIDATDGELARVKRTPSYTGRYLDSIFDSVLNFLILISIGFVSHTPVALTLLAFGCVQLQGTLYNYYYVILRNRSRGADQTSKIFETKAPKAFSGESQRIVDILFALYSMLYAAFDRTIYVLDRNAANAKIFPGWFMSLVSIYGLGFQLLLIALLLVMDKIDFVIPFFIIYTVFLFVFIGIRKTFLNHHSHNP